jgi:hypothetical protein
MRRKRQAKSKVTGKDTSENTPVTGVIVKITELASLLVEYAVLNAMPTLSNQTFV